MRAFVSPGQSSPVRPSPARPSPGQPSVPQTAAPAFLPFDAQAFVLAHRRHVPVFLIIGGLLDALSEPSLAAQIAERTVPVHLLPGMRPDVELLCRRAGALYSDEGALPLCALLLDNGCPFLAAPLPRPAIRSTRRGCSSGSRTPTGALPRICPPFSSRPPGCCARCARVRCKSPSPLRTPRTT